MNTNMEGSQPSFEMPPPVPERSGQAQEQATEKTPARPEQTANRPAQDVPLPAIPDDIPAADQTAVAMSHDDSTSAAIPRHDAKDTDRIEKVWVDKAKSVVAQTRDDPHAQKHEMSKVKAEYIQKRFNKTIKTDEAPA